MPVRCEYLQSVFEKTAALQERRKQPQHAEKYLLIHHILNNEGKPQVIETFDAPFVYSALSDSKGNLYIIYEKGDIGYKEYVWQNKEWRKSKWRRQWKEAR